MSADRAALLAAAVRAACLAKAPRRTVQAVAAAVAGVLVRPTAAAVPRTGPSERPSAQSDNDEDGAGDPAVALAALRASRRAQRTRKKARRKAAKQAAAAPSAVQSPMEVEPLTDADHTDGRPPADGAGQRNGSGEIQDEIHAAAPAPSAESLELPQTTPRADSPLAALSDGQGRCLSEGGFSLVTRSSAAPSAGRVPLTGQARQQHAAGPHGHRGGRNKS